VSCREKRDGERPSHFVRLAEFNRSADFSPRGRNLLRWVVENKLPGTGILRVSIFSSFAIFGHQIKNILMSENGE
jgi:hypothetical protein